MNEVLRLLFISLGQDVDLRTLDRQMDPRLARMDQDLRGPPQTQTTSVTALPIISATSDPRGPTAFNITDKLVHYPYISLLELIKQYIQICTVFCSSLPVEGVERSYLLFQIIVTR